MPSDDAKRPRVLVAGAIVYVALVLAVDSLATREATWPIDWRALNWLRTSDVGGPSADYFKLIFWLIIPVAMCIPMFEPRWFRFRLERRIDRYIVAGLALVGVAAVLSVPLIPALRAMYPSLSAMPPGDKVTFAFHYGIWILTWLTGWEFMHRYMIPVLLVRAFPTRAFIIGIMLMPILEGGYHVAQSKHWLECLGMAAFSAALTAWAISRRNAIYPFLAHLAIEVALIALMLVV